MKSDNVRVNIRIRPISKKEIDEGAQDCLLASGPQIDCRGTHFTFDNVFSCNVEQTEIYNQTVEPMLASLLEGFNQTVFAYGQTGSGKTYTMGGEFGKRDREHDGILPRVAEDIFERLSSMADKYKSSLQVSYFELYKEEIRDLLKPETSSKVLQVREMPNGDTVVAELSKTEVKSASELLTKLKEGNSHRSVGSTKMNATSSRSHAAFNIHLEQQSLVDPDDSKSAVLRLVDLAGSERLKRTGAEGTRKEEGVNINMGLLALGNVISALSDGEGHVKYRDSKLTRILKDSLGGNSHTLMIACVSPVDTNHDETVQTLRYADRARKIKNKPIVNRDPVQAELIKLRKQVQMFLASGATGVNTDPCETPEFLEMKEQLESQLEDYKMALSNSSKQQNRLMLKIEDESTNRNALSKKLDLLKNAAESLAADHNNMTVMEDQLASSEVDEDAAEAFKELRRLQKLILDVDQTHKKSKRLSYARVERDETDNENDLTDIQEVSGLDDSNEAVLDTPMRLHKINEDLFALQTDIETKEENIKSLSQDENNPHLLRAKYERQVTELQEKIEKLENERQASVAAKTHVAKDKSKQNEVMRMKRQKELEKEIAQLKKDKKEKERLVKEKREKEQFVEKLKNELEDLKKRKINLVKKARSDQKKFSDEEKKFKKEICTLQKADRRKANDIARMQLQHERVANRLKIQSAKDASEVKKLKMLLLKRTEHKAKAHGTVKLGHLKEQLRNDIECRMEIKRLKHQVKLCEEDRTEMKRRTKLPLISEKMTKLLKDKIKRKDAEIATIQEQINSAESHENPTSAKRLPIKDTAEARKMIEFLVNELIEQGGDCLIQTEDADQLRGNLKEISEEFNILQNKFMAQENKHQEEMRLMKLEHDEIVAERSVKEGTSEDEYPYSSEEDSMDVTYEKPIDLPKPTASKSKATKRTHLTNAEYSRIFDTPNAKLMTQTPKDDRSRDPDFAPGGSLYALPDADGDGTNSRKSQQKKRRRTAGTKCKCKGLCITKVCGCRKNSRCCSDTCGCDRSKCKNWSTEPETMNDNDFKENETETIEKSHFDVTLHGLGENRVEPMTPSRSRLFGPPQRRHLKGLDDSATFETPTK